MSPRRLLVVIDEMEVGGSQRQIVHLLTGLDRQRWQPELVFFRNESFLTGRLRDAGILVHHVPKRGRVDLRFLREFSRLLRGGKYDLIHAFSITAELWSVLGKRLSGCTTPLLASERNQQLHQPPWYWRLKHFVLSRSAGVIANSDAGAETTARRTGMPRDFFDVIPNGVQLPPPITASERLLNRAQLGVPTGRLFGLFVGRLVPQKNLDCLIRAVAMLDRDERPWIAIAGDGPLRAHATRLAAAHGVKADIRFLGERNDAGRLMQAADFLVLPSHFEGLSNSLLEAMAARCPVIASAVGGTPELVRHEHTGLLFQADDDAALAASIARMAHKPLRARLSLQAHDHVMRTYGIDTLVDATVAVYERCVGQQPDREPHCSASSLATIARDRTS